MLPEILQEMEDIKAGQMSQATAHGAIDRAGIRVDYNFALRRYMNDAVTISSGFRTSMDASVQVSSLGVADERTTTSFYTAPLSQTSEGAIPRGPKPCTQLFVRNVGSHKTMTLQVKPEHTIGTIKELVRQKIGLPDAQFELIHSSCVLYALERSLEDFDILHDTTLTCVSFRLSDPPSNIQIHIRTIYDTEKVTFELKTSDFAMELKTMFATQQAYYRIPDPVQPRYAGVELEDHKPLSTYGIGDRVVLFVMTPHTDADVGVQDINGPDEPIATMRRRTTSWRRRIPNKAAKDKEEAFWKAPFGVPGRGDLT